VGLAYFSDGEPHSGKDIEAEIGYDDSPRLKQDILDAGYEVATERDATTRSRAVYRMPHQRQVRAERERVQDLTKVAAALVRAGVARKCARCGRTEKLQPDHRIP